MNALNLSPLFRTAIGFDRLARMVDTAAAADVSYPPYNIEKTGDDSYRLTMAVAGFGPDDIEMVVKDNTLVVSGKAAAETTKGELLYRGIAGRAFERRFALADHIVVDGADLQNGLLHVGLKRVVPEALKPRRIPVHAGPSISGAPVAQQTSLANAA
jgi:molecular chaperone IbpA